MFRLLVLSLFLAAGESYKTFKEKLIIWTSLNLLTVAASSTFRHRYQLNEAIALKRQQIDLEGRIVGGTDRTIEQHPYQIGLFFNRRHTCGGSVLSVNTVLSAAHCTQWVQVRILSKLS